VPPVLIAQPGPDRAAGVPLHNPQPLEAAEHEVNRHLRHLWERDRRIRQQGGGQQQQPRLEGEVNVERVPNSFGAARK
jgi:hypothetical protein